MAATGCGSDAEDSGSPEGEDAGSSAGAEICVDQYATAGIISDLLDGLRSGLADRDVTVTVKNPEADAATQATIARQFLDGGCDVLVPVATPGAQTYAKLTREIPIVFAASSSPVEAGVVEDLERPGGNVTGVSDPYPVVSEIDAMREIDPDMKTVGVIWRNGDPSGDVLAATAKQHMEELGITTVDANITNAGDATQAAQSLVGRVDAIMLPGDTATISAVPAILKVANAAEVPVFGSTSDTVKQGGVVAGSYDYTQVGEETARLVGEVLDGADPGEIPVVVPDAVTLAINETVARRLGLEVPPDLLERASEKH
jgi:putative ABC transport system substrate-binding protein